MITTRAEYDPRLEPSMVAEWNGSRAEFYQLDELLSEDAPSRAILYASADFPEPIRKLTIMSQRLIDGDGEFATVFNAEIDLGALSQQRWRNFLKYLRTRDSAFQNPAEDHVLVPDPSVPNTYQLVVDEEAILTVEFNRDVPHARVHTMPNEDIPLHANNSDGLDASILYFMNTVMYTADFIAGIEESIPATRRLEKTYELGRDIVVVPKPLTPAPIVGQLAIEGAVGQPDESEQIVEEAGAHGPMLKDVGGLLEVKKELERVVMAYQYPEIMKKWGAHIPSGIFFYGPAGTGKTMLANALANEIGAELIEVKGSDIVDKWTGNSEKFLNAIFDSAEKDQKVVILFFDEFETVIGGETSSERMSVIGAFKRRSAQLRQKNPHALLVAATNQKDKIDSALLRSGRFDLQLYVDKPNKEARADILMSLIGAPGLDEAWQNILNEESAQAPAEEAAAADEPAEAAFAIFANDINPFGIAEITPDFTGSDLKAVLDSLRLKKAMQEASGLVPTPISHRDIEQEIRLFQTRSQVDRNV